MKSRDLNFYERRNGFSLIELMVGITIAMIASLVIIQVLSSYESQKRSTTAGSEAQENGLIALTQLEQGIHNAGNGINDPAILGCTSMYTYLDQGGGNGGPIPNFSLAPVSISDGASSTSNDTITVRSADNLLANAPGTLSSTMPSPSSVFNVTNPSEFNIGDFGIVMQGGKCATFDVTNVTIASKNVDHNKGTNGPNNPTANYINSSGWPAFTSGAKITSLGTLRATTYSIDSNNNLNAVETDVSSGNTLNTWVLAKNIVSLQAQYGVSSATGQQTVSAWVNATGATWAAPSSTDVQRIKAIRIVVIARSSKMEVQNVTGTCKNNAGTNNGPCAWQDSASNPAPLIDLSSNANWKKYRYKVYQTIIPLRNVIWANV